MSSKLKANIIKAACDTANAIAKADHEAGNLANALLKSVHEGREAGLSVDTIWAEIARAGGYQDKTAKLEGIAMPKTLQVYRAKHRKGDKVGASFNLSWPLFLADIKRLSDETRSPRTGSNEAEQSSESETGETPEKKLTEIAIPAAIARALADKRMGLAIEKRIAFDAKITAWIASYGV